MHSSACLPNLYHLLAMPISSDILSSAFRLANDVPAFGKRTILIRGFH